MINKKITALTVALLSSSIAAHTYAQADNDNWRFQPEFSVGAGYGLTKAKDSDFNEDEAAKKIFAVVKFNEYIGVEASYIDFDNASNGVFSLDAKGQTLALILEAPLTEGISLYAKGGQLWWDADASVNSSAFTAKDNYDGKETFWGGGVKFRLAENLDLRVEYERFNFDISRDEINALQTRDINMDVDFASVNLQFTF